MREIAFYLKIDKNAKERCVLEPIEKEVNGYKRRVSKTRRDELLKNLPVREVHCTLPEEEQYCGQCHMQLKVLGT